MRIKIFLKSRVLRLLTICGVSALVVGFTLVFFSEALGNALSPFFKKVNNTAEIHDEDTTIKLPIIMYHSLLKGKGKNQFIVDPDLFESDLKYLKDNGYNTIFVKELIDYVYEGKTLPENPIMLTFDDGYYNNFVYALPAAKKYESKFIISPIAKVSENYSKISEENINYSHITWSHLKEMLDSGLVEVGNHSYNLHSTSSSRLGCRKKKNENVQEYQNVLIKDLMTAQKLITENTGVTPQVFVYPFGAYSPCSTEIIKNMGFKSTLLCSGKINNITKDPNCLFGLCRFLRPCRTSSKAFFSKILK